MSTIILALFFSGVVLALNEIIKLTASDAAVDAWLGSAAAISNDTMVVGAPGAGGSVGAAYIFQKDFGGANAWGQRIKLIPPASVGTTPIFFGSAVAIDGDLVAVGAPGDTLIGTTASGTLAGAAYIFSRHQGGTDNWGFLRRLASDTPSKYDQFGESVATSSGLVVVGATKVSTSNIYEAGAAYVFSQNSGGANMFAQVKKLTASDPTTHSDFGAAVAVRDGYVVVGAPLANAAYLYKKDFNGQLDSYGQAQKLTGSGASINAAFGSSVAFAGTTALVGAPTQSAAFIFYKDQNGTDSWGQLKKLSGSDAGGYDGFGRSVALAGNAALVGAYELPAGSTRGAGATYYFNRNMGGSDNWGEVNKLSASDASVPEAFFGQAVSISGQLGVVGAMHAQAGGLARSGASYIFNQLACVFGLATFGGCTL